MNLADSRMDCLRGCFLISISNNSPRKSERNAIARPRVEGVVIFVAHAHD